MSTVYTASWSGSGDSYDWVYTFQMGRAEKYIGIKFGARNYYPLLQVWMEPDPAQYVDGMDRYQLDSSNPVSFVDPSGLDPSGTKAPPATQPSGGDYSGPPYDPSWPNQGYWKYLHYPESHPPTTRPTHNGGNAGGGRAPVQTPRPSSGTSWRCYFDIANATAALMIANADLAATFVTLFGVDEASVGTSKLAEVATLAGSIYDATQAINDMQQSCSCNDSTKPTVKELKDKLDDVKDKYKKIKDGLKKLKELGVGE